MPTTVPPTLLSNFELLFAPQLPTGVPVPTPVRQISETVLKGYFLTISNPNAVAYTFDVGLHTSADLRTQAVALSDGGMPGMAVNITGSAPNFSVRITVPAGGTVLLGIFPLFFNSTGFPAANIDIRGYVDLSLPALLRLPSYRYVAQSVGPVQVLVTAEERLTFLPVSGSPSTVVENQSAFALPLAGGSASLSIPPQPGGPIFVPPPPVPIPTPVPVPLPTPDPGPLATAALRPSPEARRPTAVVEAQQLIERDASSASAVLSHLLELTPAVASGKKTLAEVYAALEIAE